MKHEAATRPVLVLRLRALPGVVVVKALRRGLKYLKRTCGLQCLDYSSTHIPQETIMPRMKEYFSATYKRASDMTGSEIVTISGWRKAEAYGSDFVALELRGQNEALKLTGALWRDLKDICGDDDTDSFIGLTVELYKEPKKISDRQTGEEKMVDVFRARAVPGQTVRPKVPKPRADLDDTIPF